MILTERQHTVARLVAAGLTNKQIAREIGLSPSTVKNHVHAAIGKLGVRRRAAIGAKLAEIVA